MKFYSTSNKSHRVGLREAVIQGLAPDNGLYMPEQLPLLSKSFFESLPKLTLREIGFEVANQFLVKEVSSAQLHSIIEHTIQFDAPLVPVEEDIFSLELFHGPTLAFKDFGARFLAALLGHFANEQNQVVTILVATSGDTGSAVANAFLQVPGTRVVVLYPSGKVSEIQEQQFTTLGANITALEIQGTFDDCQRLVKSAFLDPDLKQSFFLTSANSINIARLIPQSFYYFYGWGQLKYHGPVVFSVPSGNFGNLTAGIIAKKMGLPIDRFIASTNVNDVVPSYLKTKSFQPRSSLATISNAMDVGNPSNFARLLDLYQHDFAKFSSEVVGFSATDAETIFAMKEIYKTTGYLLDPHGAVGYLGLKNYLRKNSGKGIFLETAHPAKFIQVVENALQVPVSMPERLSKFRQGTKHSILMKPDFSEFKSWLPTLLTQ